MNSVIYFWHIKAYTRLRSVEFLKVCMKMFSFKRFLFNGYFQHETVMEIVVIIIEKSLSPSLSLSLSLSLFVSLSLSLDKIFKN